jgi:hypothetical protein
MPIECKVSNSKANAVKRLNNTAAVKAAVWKPDLVNAAYGLAPDEVELMWATTPPRMPGSPPG